MKTLAIALVGALCYTANVQAQSALDVADAYTSTTAAPTEGDDHNCIMAPEATWKTLGLSAEQITKVQDLQARCSKDAAGEKTSADMTKHEQELATILTKEQYANWQKWCKEKGSAPGK